MAMHNDQRAADLRWHLEDIDFSSIDTARMRVRDDIFLLVCSASFVESGAETYAHNLVDYFTGDTEVGEWLNEHWKVEELQHGRALKTYVQHVWPEFDWDSAYAAFFAEYAKLCTCDELEPTRGQELVARCIVEMGTTTYYQALNAVCDEPVLRDLTWRIRTDEVQHYKHFYHYFLRYQQQENLHRPHVIAALWRRVAPRMIPKPMPKLLHLVHNRLGHKPRHPKLPRTHIEKTLHTFPCQRPSPLVLVHQPIVKA